MTSGASYARSQNRERGLTSPPHAESRPAALPRDAVRRSTLRRVVAAAAVCGVLAACGGGGGGGGTSPPLPAPPSQSDNANLASLTLDGIALDRAFDPAVTDYAAAVNFLVDSAGIVAAPEDTAATMTVNGSPLSGAATTIGLQPGSNDVLLEVTAQDGVTTRQYVVDLVRQTAAAFAQDAYIKASNAETADLFGRSVALDGDTLVVGASSEDGNGVSGPDDNNAESAGAVYVFTRDGSGTWAQEAYLKASNAEAFDQFGIAVAISGDTLAVGANGEDGDGIGGPGDNSASSAGAVYVFTRDGAGGWTERAYLKAPNARATDAFGLRIALSGDTLAVGATGEDGDGVSGPGDDSASNAGAVYVFSRDGAGAWVEQAYLKASNAQPEDRFGSSVALSGDTLVVSAPLEDGNGIGGEMNNDAGDSGAVYVFTRDSFGEWTQEDYLKASNAQAEDNFGTYLAVFEDTLAVGAIGEDGDGVNGPGDNSLSRAGAVYVFARDGTGGWSQHAYLKASDAGVDGLFGRSVALSDNALAVGAIGDDGDGISSPGNSNAPFSGAVYLFSEDGAGGWVQQARLKASNLEGSDTFGLDVALAGHTLAASSYLEAGNGIDGEDDNSAPGAGAVYTFGGTPSRSPELSSLGIDGFALDQVFQPMQGHYTASVGFLVTSIDLALDADAPFSVLVGGVPVHPANVELSLDEGTNVFEIQIIAEDGVTARDYSLTVSRELAETFAQRAYLKASNAGIDDQLGESIAISGDTLAVGAPAEDGNGADPQNDDAMNAGAVYVFVRDAAGVWRQQAYLKASNADAGDLFGYSVAISGDRLAVSALGEDGNGSDGPGNNDASGAGAVYVFSRNGAGDWTEEAYLKASNAETLDGLGISVALTDDTLAVGAAGEDSDDPADETNNDALSAGAVYVFTRNGAGHWDQQAYLKADGTETGDFFGYSVALSGDALAIGARGEDGNGVSGPGDNSALSAGAAYVFTRDGVGRWTERAYLKASNAQVGDQFGSAVSISDFAVAVGATRESGNGVDGEMNNDVLHAGAVYIFDRDNDGVWMQRDYLKASNPGASDIFGRSLALSGDTLAVGASSEDGDADGDGSNDGAPDAGAVYLFTRDGAGDWVQQAYVKASNADSGDLFGSAVALSGDTLAVSASGEDSDGLGGETNDDTANAGAVYVLQ